MPDAYEIPSAAIAAHFWAKYTLPKILAQVAKEQEAKRERVSRAIPK